MNSLELPLTQQKATALVARALSVVFLVWSVMSLLSVPGLAAGLLHYHTHLNDSLPMSDYYPFWTRRYEFWILGALIRAGVELWIARTLYRCSPKVMQFFLNENSPEASGDQPRA